MGWVFDSACLLQLSEQLDLMSSKYLAVMLTTVYSRIVTKAAASQKAQLPMLNSELGNSEGQWREMPMWGGNCKKEIGAWRL